MRKILFILLSLFCISSTSAKEVYLFSYFCNESDGLHLAYSYDGLVWKALNGNQSYLQPMVGRNKLMRDPSIVQGKDGTFHMVWTDSWFDKTIGYASSKDLIHWSEQRTIPVMEDEPSCENCWAPELFYDKRADTYYIIWSSTIPGRHKYVATNENERQWNQKQYEQTCGDVPPLQKFDPNLNHRIYYTTTKDFKTFTKSKIFFNPDFNVIDAAIIRDPKTKEFIMTVKNENTTPWEKNIRITTTRNIGKGFNTKVSPKITGEYPAEGPSPLFVGDTLYVYFDKYSQGKYGAVRSIDHGKSWEDVSDKVSFPRGTKHGTAFKVDEAVLENLKQHAQPRSAQWIESVNNKNEVNTWQVFRKEVNLSYIPKEVFAKIAVDSKYWLMINGKQVVFEGGLKRGPSPADTYYDEINIAPYLQKGNNTIAILTVYFGKEGFSHKSSGHGALLFEAHAGKTNILSDETWDAAVYEAYGKINQFIPNWRLPESNICFDGRKSWEQEWFQASSKMSTSVKSNFSKARVLDAQAENSIFGKLVKRPIPFFKDFGLKPYVSQHFDEKTRLLTCRLPYNAQVTPYLKIRGETEGDTIFIRTDHPKVGREHCVTAAYITRKGEQEYESLGWMNGDYVYYKIPQGVEVEQVLYRETGYDTEFVSDFHCNDSFFNELWKRSVRTMYVNMRDTYFDCPDRERSQWWGDVCNDIQQSFYVFSPSSWQLVNKGIYELINWQRKDGTLFSPVPAGNWEKELPCQMLQSLGWYGFRAQAFYSGDYSFVPYVYDGMHKYLHEVWKMDQDGFPLVREGGWSFADWGKHIDLQLITIEWYYLALKSELEFAQRLHKQADVSMIKDMMERMERNFNQRFWKGDHYRSESYQDKTIDDRAQALAILCGFAEKEKYAALKNAFEKSRYASPYMELYVQLALFQMGESQFAQKRAKERYSQMLQHKDMTTLFEHWGVSASTNHGWSSGMTTILSQEVCGIRPTSEGFKTFEVCPHLAGLTDISTNVETRYGFIRVNIKQKGKKAHLTLTVPKGTTATVVMGKKHKTFKKGTHKYKANYPW